MTATSIDVGDPPASGHAWEEPSASGGRSMARAVLLAFIVLSIVTGIVYPLAVTGIAQLAFPHQADGSLLHEGRTVVGSSLIGQAFDDPRYFWSRPSATSPYAYNAASSAGSNLSVLDPALKTRVSHTVGALRKADPSNTEPIPADLATSSASGLDPHISPAAAEWQSARVAAARGVDRSVVERLIREHTSEPALGLLGEPHVNVLQLNLALDALGGR